MRRLVLVILCAVVGWAGASLATQPAFGSDLCVGGNKPACFSTIQAALDSSNHGDTIKIGPGTFAGGLTIDKSVRVIGAGASATIIRGGGPVVTIGVFDAPSEPTVTIKGVTITGGVNTSNPAPFFTAGGGVAVPASVDGGLGATVTISDSAITGNRAAPESVLPSPSGVLCGGGTFCPYAQGEGGGIFNTGTMTLTNVVVSSNEAGSSVASDADAAGISNQPQASLTLRHCVVSGNVARAPAPNGRFAEGAGIFTRRESTLTIDDSVVSGNRAELVVAQEILSNDTSAQAGGIRIGVDATTTITRTSIRGNSASGSNLFGDAVAFGGGIVVLEGSLDLRDSVVDHNQARASVPPSSDGSALADGGGIDMEGVATISNSVIGSNSVSSVGEAGTAVVQGGGVANAGQLTLHRTLVVRNSEGVRGKDGVAEGGGIWNNTFDGSTIAELSLVDSAVIGNSLTASPGIPRRGGGLFTSFPVTLARTVLAGNQPDQCFGC